MSDDTLSETPKWFAKEVVKCPTCNEKYERMIFDREQIVCPRCINRKWLEPESK